ncbi:MAG: hypothetical protein WA919_21280 [Coleofasciculaceae cyanobacterium]
MPSAPPPGRYQSRLFNFINRQSQKLADQSRRALRHLKIAAVWGAQILLYPVYLLVQTGLSVGRQLSWAKKTGKSPLRTLTQFQRRKKLPASDQAVVRILKQVKTLQLPQLSGSEKLAFGAGEIEAAHQSLHRQELRKNTSSIEEDNQTPQLRQAQNKNNQGWMLQGVANLLTGRSLVVIVVPNRILDVLTTEQQKKLSSQISWEVAELMRRRRLAASSPSTETHLSLANLAKPHVFPPVKLFWQLMAWVQTSPLAITINLFEESSLVRTAATEKGEVQLFNSATNVSQDGSSLIAAGSTVVIVISERTVELLQKLQKQWLTLKYEATSPETSRNNISWIQAIIYAAIRYFFGRRKPDNLANRKYKSASLSQSLDTAANLAKSDATPKHSAIGSSSHHTSTAAKRLSGSSHLQEEVLTKKSFSSAAINHSKAKNKSASKPWLKWSDLFGKPDKTEVTNHSQSHISNSQIPAQLPESANSKVPQPGNSPQEFIKGSLSSQQPPGKLSKSSQSLSETREEKTQSREDESITGNLQPSSRTSLNSHNNNDVKAEGISKFPPQDDFFERGEDWIETQATPTGYVKHPLEQVLGWLDRVMLWIEELFIKVWRWFQRLRGKE